MSLLSAGELRRLPGELGDALEARGIRGDMFIVGGAAMALAASRVERDADDIAALFRLSGFGSVDEALQHVEHTYPQLRLLPKAQYLLEELWEAGALRSDTDEASGPE